jgi:hypothetical protein
VNSHIGGSLDNDGRKFNLSMANYATLEHYNVLLESLTALNSKAAEYLQAIQMVSIVACT